MENLKSNAAEKRSAFYSSTSLTRKLDNSFAHENDKELTRDEIRQINQYWSKYKFAYPDIDYKSFKTFKNRSGKFDVRHCPGAVRKIFFHKHFVDRNYLTALQNKGLLPALFHDVKQPRTVLRRMGGIFLDENYRPMTQDQAVSMLLKESLRNRLIMKTDHMGGGRGIYILDHRATKASLENAIAETQENTFVVQEFMEQSAFMKQFNESSVNTLRITTLIWNDRVHVLAVLLRAGKEGSQIDNFSQGGYIIGVDKQSGVCNPWALTHENERITILPNGMSLAKKKLVVPHFSRALALVEKMHYRIPYIRMVSWDIALDKSNAPVLIENNFGGMIQLHEAVTGPVFGEFMDELLDTYLIEQFSIEFRAGDFLCAEFHDHVEIKDYVGKTRTVTVPEKLEDKPVTKIQPGAFRSRGVDTVYASEDIIRQSEEALKAIPTVLPLRA